MSTKTAKSAARVLVVDDEPANLLVVRRVLAPLDIELIEVTSGQEALSQILRHEFAVVLMDVQMPDMDGFETAALIRDHPNGAEVPLIFLTAWGRDERLQLTGYAQGAVDYLFKPVEPEVLRSKVRVFVRLYRQRLLIETQRQDLARSNRDLDDYAAVVAHDLRAPLRHCAAFADLLARDEQSALSDKGLKYLGRIREASARLDTMTKSLLELARVGRSGTAPSAIGLGEVVDDVLEVLAKPIAEAGARVERDELPEVVGDPVLLARVFQNLISNALVHGGVDDQGPAVRIEAERSGDDGVVSVGDDGPGFSEAQAQRIFQPFLRLRPDAADGTGMGLAITRRIVEHHGGRVWAESAPGEGATFRFTVPATGAA